MDGALERTAVARFVETSIRSAEIPVHVRRRLLVVIVAPDVVGKSRHAPLPSSPAEPSPEAQPRKVVHALSHVEGAGAVRRVERVGDGGADRRLLSIVKVVRTQNTRIEQAEVAPFPIVAQRPVDALELSPSLVPESGVVDEQDQRSRLRIDVASWIRDQRSNRLLEGRAGRGQEIVGAARRARQIR